VLRYALLRILGAIPTLLLVITIAFLMVHAAPGGPFDNERAMTPDVARNIDRYYHLDEPLPQQFFRYLGGVVRGDLGPSFRFDGFTVTEIIADALPLSMRLGALAILVALILGVAAGTLAAVQKHSLVDRIVTGIAMIGISIPVFVVAPLMVLAGRTEKDHVDWSCR
jgi:oligopeptide transport system permease protein